MSAMVDVGLPVVAQAPNASHSKQPSSFFGINHQCGAHARTSYAGFHHHLQFEILILWRQSDWRGYRLPVGYSSSLSRLPVGTNYSYGNTVLMYVRARGWWLVKTQHQQLLVNNEQKPFVVDDDENNSRDRVLKRTSVDEGEHEEYLRRPYYCMAFAHKCISTIEYVIFTARQSKRTFNEPPETHCI
jgi:hypothetical protein